MLASTREAHAMPLFTFTCLSLLFMVGAIAATLSTMMGDYVGTIFALFCMGAIAYAMKIISNFLR